jgi:hypothetical protein
MQTGARRVPCLSLFFFVPFFMRVLDEFRQSLKMAEVEEVLDLVFYRPLGFGFVKAIYRLPITPNQVTLLSFVAGIISAYCFTLGTAPGFAWGGVWFMIANVLDCSDGQLARLHHSGSPFGRVVDGLVDWMITVAIFFGVAIGLSAYSANAAYWYLAVAGGVSSALHAIMFDYCQQEYISNVRGEENFLSRELDRARAEVVRLGGTGRSSFRRTWLTIYLWYMQVQLRAQFKKGQRRQYPPEIYRAANGRVMRWWTFLGTSTNRSLLAIAALAGRPDLFLWFVAIPGNLYLLVMLVWQRRVQQRLDATPL